MQNCWVLSSRLSHFPKSCLNFILHLVTGHLLRPVFTCNFKRTPKARSRWHNQISRRFQWDEVRFNVKSQRQGRESAGGQLPPPVIIVIIIMAPTLSRPPARIHFLCQAHRKDESVRGKDPKPLQSINKRLLVLIKTLSGLIAYWSWSSRIKDSFGKHMTGVTEKENNQCWFGFGLFKGQLKSKCSVPRLPVDGCVWPRWQFIRHPNISDEISMETHHPFPAAASSFASGWNSNPDIVREIEDELMWQRSH